MRPGHPSATSNTGDERSDFQFEPLGVSLRKQRRKGEKEGGGRGVRGGLRQVERMGGGISEFLLPSSVSPPLHPVAPPRVPNAPRLSGCCFDSWTVSVCC